MSESRGTYDQTPAERAAALEARPTSHTNTGDEPVALVERLRAEASPERREEILAKGWDPVVARLYNEVKNSGEHGDGQRLAFESWLLDGKDELLLEAASTLSRQAQELAEARAEAQSLIDSVGLVCSGCGSRQSLAALRREHPGAVSCCPERRMVPANLTAALEEAGKALDAIELLCIDQDTGASETVEEIYGIVTRSAALRSLPAKGRSARRLPFIWPLIRLSAKR